MNWAEGVHSSVSPAYDHIAASRTLVNMNVKYFQSFSPKQSKFVKKKMVKSWIMSDWASNEITNQRALSSSSCSRKGRKLIAAGSWRLVIRRGWPTQGDFAVVKNSQHDTISSSNNNSNCCSKKCGQRYAWAPLKMQKWACRYGNCTTATKNKREKIQQKSQSLWAIEKKTIQASFHTLCINVIMSNAANCVSMLLWV